MLYFFFILCGNQKHVVYSFLFFAAVQLLITPLVSSNFSIHIEYMRISEAQEWTRKRGWEAVGVDQKVGVREAAGVNRKEGDKLPILTSIKGLFLLSWSKYHLFLYFFPKKKYLFNKYPHTGSYALDLYYFFLNSHMRISYM